MTTILEGENKDNFPPLQIQASIDSGSNILSRDWGSLGNGDKYQQVVHVNKGAKLRLQAVARGTVLAKQDVELKLGQETVVDLLVDTESSVALKILNTGAAQSAYRFVRSLEERRQFIRQRRGEIMAEIANGMPKWETKPADPAVMPSIKTFALGFAIGGCIGCITGTSFNLAIEFARWTIGLF